MGVARPDVNKPEALPMPKVDEPTLTMNLMVNTSPLAGQEGKFVTSRQIRERLNKELLVTVDGEDTNQGVVMEELGRRRGDLQDMQPDGHGRVRLEYRIPARGLIGFQSEFMTMTRGTGIMAHVFDDYAPVKADMPGRRNGVLLSAR